MPGLPRALNRRKCLMVHWSALLYTGLEINQKTNKLMVTKGDGGGKG